MPAAPFVEPPAPSSSMAAAIFACWSPGVDGRATHVAPA
jgi:hypothetical protein